MDLIIDPSAMGYFDPYLHYRALREQRSVYEDPRGPWMAFRYVDMQKVLRDPGISSRLANAPNPPSGPGALGMHGTRASSRIRICQEPIRRTMWKRGHLGDDLMSLLVTTHEEHQVLSLDEMVEQVRLLFAAGHETIVNAIGNAMLALQRHCDQRTLLVANRLLIPNAVEELLRDDNTIQIAWRTTPADFD